MVIILKGDINALIFCFVLFLSFFYFSNIKMWHNFGYVTNMDPISLAEVAPTYLYLEKQII